ncbi:MAG: serine/threonine-protein phosphatase [Eubacterium sp.]|nr:serine/threonine-protein phosphatase [Eubacterium sp.]
MKKIFSRLIFKIVLGILVLGVIAGFVIRYVLSSEFTSFYLEERSAEIEKANTGFYDTVEFALGPEYSPMFEYWIKHSDDTIELIRKNEHEEFVTKEYIKIKKELGIEDIDSLDLYSDGKYSDEKYDYIKLLHVVAFFDFFAVFFDDFSQYGTSASIIAVDKNGNGTTLVSDEIMDIDTYVKGPHSTKFIIDIDDYPVLKKMMQSETTRETDCNYHRIDENGDRHMTVYTTAYILPDGTHIFIKTDLTWTRLYTNMSSTVNGLVWGAIAVLSIFVVFILVTIYIIVIRKTTRIKKAIVSYEEEKDPEIMKSILDKQSEKKDEMGSLANELIVMSDTIHSYVEEKKDIAVRAENYRVQMEIASTIQKNNLILNFDEVTAGTGVSVYAGMKPLREVGGDYYGCVRIDDDHIAFLIADVSDKGIPAALYMMNSKTLIESSLMSGHGAAEALNMVNDTLAENNDADMFVTVWLAILTVSAGELKVINAGHENPLIKKAFPAGQKNSRDSLGSSPEGLKLSSDSKIRSASDEKGSGKWSIVRYPHFMPVGSIEDMGYEEHSYTLDPGDIVFVYTDGVTDAKSPSGERFGEERIRETLDELDTDDAREIVDMMNKKIIEFTGDEALFDDITMLCFKYQ